MRVSTVSHGKTAQKHVRVSKREGVSGFSCSACGKWSPFAAYVFGHLNDMLVHTCECGAKHSVQQLKVKRFQS